MRPLPNPHAQSRRQQILHTALKLFAQQGYEETSLQDIIETAGVSKGGFYHHFRSKADLVDSIAQTMMSMVLTTVADVVKRNDLSALEKLNEHFRLVNSQKTQHVDEVTVILFELYSGHKNLLLEDRIFRLGRDRLEPLIRAIIDQGTAEGTFRVPYPAEAAELYVHLFLYNQRQAAETFTQILRTRNPEPLVSLKRRYGFVQDLLEHTLGLAPGSLVLQEVAAATLDDLWQQIALGDD